MERSLKATGQWSGELVHTRRDGQRIVVASRMSVRKDELGRPVATLELNTDLSQHRTLQSDLRESDERFRVLVEAVRDYAIFLLAPDGTVLTWNEGAQRLKGFLPEDIIGQSFTRFYTPDDLEAGLPQRLLERAAAEGRAEHEGWRVRKDGTRFWANVILTAFRNPDGTLRGFAKITRDLSERKDAEEARARASREEGARAAAEAAAAEIRTSRDQLAAILAGVTDGITVLDQSGRMRFANDAAAQLCGFRDEAELRAATPSQILRRFELLDANGVALHIEQLPTRRALMGETPLADSGAFSRAGDWRRALVDSQCDPDSDAGRRRCHGGDCLPRCDGAEEIRGNCQIPVRSQPGAYAHPRLPRDARQSRRACSPGPRGLVRGRCPG